MYIYFSGTPTHSESCDSKAEYVLPKEHRFFLQIYSGLLAAMHSNSIVNGYINAWSNSKTKRTKVDLLS